MTILCMFFFVKQKTAYEMRISDWSSDVCSSDLERSGHCLLLRKSFAEDGQASIAHSLVELVDLPAMAPFQRALGRLLGRQLPVPPPHVTLYTADRKSTRLNSSH